MSIIVNKIPRTVKLFEKDVTQKQGKLYDFTLIAEDEVNRDFPVRTRTIYINMIKQLRMRLPDRRKQPKGLYVTKQLEALRKV